MMKRKTKRAHFIGIGGIGISALARWYLSESWRVTGSDLAESEITRDLKNKGAKIFIGAHRESNVPRNAELLVYTVAAQRANPERVAARRLGIPEKTYPEALGNLAKRYKTIAISGAHGKSTTTAMAALMLIEAGFDPTVFVGTRLKEFGGANFRKGKSEWLLIEADEYHSSFLNYRPFAAITTNIDREHLEYFKSFANVKRVFEKFYAKIAAEGFLIRNRDHKELRSLNLPKGLKSFWYSLKDPRVAAIKKELKVPGAHNLSNALACDRLGEVLGISIKIRDRALAKFRGTWRRFEYKGARHGVKIYDDYAHHPTEIKATLQGAREAFPKSKIIVVFQPHLSERLELLFREFTLAFRDADLVGVLETFKVPGRERGTVPRNARALAKAIAKKRPAEYLPDHARAEKWVRKLAKPRNIVIFMGAGDVKNISETLLNSRGQKRLNGR